MLIYLCVCIKYVTNVIICVWIVIRYDDDTRSPWSCWSSLRSIWACTPCLGMSIKCLLSIFTTVIMVLVWRWIHDHWDDQRLWDHVMEYFNNSLDWIDWWLWQWSDWRSWQDQYMIDQLIMTIMISHLSLLRAALDLPPLPPLLPESDWELDGINSKIEMGAQFHLYIYCIVVLNMNISPSLLTAFSAWLFIIFRISFETHAKSPKTLTEIQSWSPSFTIYTSTMFRFFPGNV